ncbi:MAG: energy-coupling factor ABC transporter ATP-binding protein [Actinomycetota bacterium]|nr:energy-coupling factor ABC transporter ATP-binding protein [Actinomycetota bacterium]
MAHQLSGSQTTGRTGGADIKVEGLAWRPLGRRTPVFAGLDLEIPPGQRVLLAGPSGSGKSTLLRAVAGLLLTAGHGDLSGRVLVDGVDVRASAPRAGLLLQDPRAAVVAETVGRDVAFGLENLRVPRDAIWPRVEAALAASRFPYGVGHATTALSGGETQRLALAGSLVLDNPVLLLDEPTSMLDDVAADDVRRAVMREVGRLRCTTVVVEHHLEPWMDFVDRLIVLDSAGRIVADGPASDVMAAEGTGLAALGVWVPGLPAPEPTDVDLDLVAPWAARQGELVTADRLRVELRAPVRTRRSAPTVALGGVDASLTAGRALAVTGPSGAGKSTLVAALAGLLRPTSGTIRSHRGLATRKTREPWRWSAADLTARLAWVAQVPEHGIVTRTVLDEVLTSGRSCGRDPEWLQLRAHRLLELFGLSHLQAASPYHLSGGEQRRLMLVAALAHGPQGLLLDEPTVGQDRSTWAVVVGAMTAARDAGSGVAVSTHDQRAVGATADNEIVLAEGRRV